ncbi:hypothetical protein C8R47DRAFT_602447 [Mycena vitilis]|nr:hypothetical protein C8R47DRAFT_602447 [Mycena vitilis]
MPTDRTVLKTSSEREREMAQRALRLPVDEQRTSLTLNKCAMGSDSPQRGLRHAVDVVDVPRMPPHRLEDQRSAARSRGCQGVYAQYPNDQHLRLARPARSELVVSLHNQPPAPRTPLPSPSPMPVLKPNREPRFGCQHPDFADCGVDDSRAPLCWASPVYSRGSTDSIPHMRRVVWYAYPPRPRPTVLPPCLTTTSIAPPPRR